MVKENRTFEEFTENKGLSKKEGFSINYSLGTVTPGLPTTPVRMTFKLSV